MENPCRYCTQRKAGYGASCTKWAAYTVLRNAEYKKRGRAADLKAGWYDHNERVRKIKAQNRADTKRGEKYYGN